MFLGYQNGKIVLVANTREELENAPCMKFHEIIETTDEYVLWNGEYMLKAVAEEKQAEATKQAKIKEYKQQLDLIDLKSIRSIRAKQSGSSSYDDDTKLAELEAQATSIRKQLKELEK